VALFAECGYAASDFVRALIAERGIRVEPWYRFNTLFFYRDVEVPPLVARHAVRDPRELARHVTLGWRLRSALIGMLPVGAVTFLANCKHRLRGG
jgi:hypothetical protein